MSTRSSFDVVKGLEEAGIDSKHAVAFVQAMEETVGTPLTQEMFDARNEALLARFDVFDVQLKSLKETVSDSAASLKKELELKEQAFEMKIEASIAKGRLATLTGIWVIATSVVLLLFRAFFFGTPIP